MPSSVTALYETHDTVINIISSKRCAGTPDPFGLYKKGRVFSAGIGSPREEEIWLDEVRWLF